MANIHIAGAEHVNEDTAPLLLAAIARVNRHQHVNYATIYLEPRRPDGWLEFMAAINYEGNSKMVIGCIQRTAGAQIEFHS